MRVATGLLLLLACLLALVSLAQSEQSRSIAQRQAELLEADELIEDERRRSRSRNRSRARSRSRSRSRRRSGGARRRGKIFGENVNADPGNGGSRSRRTGFGEEGYIPGQTQLSRSRDRASSVTPSAGTRPGGSFDPFAVTGAHTYGFIPGQGFGFIGNPHQPWYMPNRKSWSECDPAIHKNCATSNGPLPYGRGAPFPSGASLFGMYPMPNSGWWEFHPAFSARGTRDPIPNRVAPPPHLLSHYWSLLHPARPGLQHAGGINPHMAYFGNPFFNAIHAPNGFSGYHAGASHNWVGPGAIARNKYQGDEVNQYPKNWLTAAPLNADAGSLGPYAFEPPHILGSSFMPPANLPGPQDATGTNGVAPTGPFDSAPAFETLRKYDAHMGLTPIPLSSTASPAAPWLNPSGYSGRSADPGHAPNAAFLNHPVWDKINTGKYTQKKLQKPVTDVMAPGPAMLGQHPAPQGP